MSIIRRVQLFSYVSPETMVPQTTAADDPPVGNRTTLLSRGQLPSGKTLDSFDFATVPMVSHAHVTALASGDAWLIRPPARPKLDPFVGVIEGINPGRG